jgi:hypothetical protein
MATTVFVSPGVYTREQDFTFFASRIGLTRLGLVGLTPKGPAFEPIKVTSSEAFSNRFGNPNSEFPLTYVAYRFLSQSSELTLTRVLGQVGFTGSNAWIVTSETPAPYDYSGTSLCVLKSKKNAGGNFIYSASADLQISATTGVVNSFVLYSPNNVGPLSGGNGVTVSLNEIDDTYIVKLLGKTPKAFEGDYGVYVDAIYPHLVRQSAAAGATAYTNTVGSALTTTLEYRDVTNYEYLDYNTSFKNSKTPMIVGEVIGAVTKDLFRFETISDGNASSSEIKVSIVNIDTINGTFDVVVRRFYDTDATTLTSGRLENFRGCTMNKNKPNFIAKMIGSTDEVYPRQSNYITVTMADNFPQDTVPAGFRGYTLRSDATAVAPQLLYKVSYLSSDTVSKTYLGCSELAYTGLTQAIVGVKNAVQTLEVDTFKFQGNDLVTNVKTIQGFHLENTANSTEFITGIYSSLSQYTKPQRKFTVVPSGGFDGWQPFVAPTFTDDLADEYNLAAFEDCVDLMAPPESVDINIFAAPDVNYQDHLTAVNYALSMVEQRADSLYIIESPRLSTDTLKATSIDAANAIQASAIDSSYAATYWPWIQIEDPTSNKFIYISPTAEVVRNIALTDNVAYQWFAPAGLSRGQVNCVRADINLSRDDRDTLYDVNINPINTVAQQGVTIQGQKTLQIESSALDRINVRRLMLQIRRVVAAASQTLLFEPNDQTVRDQFLAKVEPILLQIQNQRGIFAYKVIVDDFNTATADSDRNTLTGKIQIKPTPALEFVDLTFQVLPTGANFEDF